MKTYSEKLKDPRWQKKRLEIMDRDKFECQYCADTKTTLEIHHIKYIFNIDVWDYDNNLLITLCSDCHKRITNLKKNIKENIDLSFTHIDVLSELNNLILTTIYFNPYELLLVNKFATKLLNKKIK